MLMFSLAIFTLVALMGVSMGLDAFKGRETPRQFAMIHGVLAALGAALVIGAAWQGDGRVLTNIYLAVPIFLIGICLSSRRALGSQAKGMALIHGGAAAVCYAILAYYALGLGG
jgi:hypothetical protein